MCVLNVLLCSNPYLESEGKLNTGRPPYFHPSRSGRLLFSHSGVISVSLLVFRPVQLEVDENTERGLSKHEWCSGKKRRLHTV